MKLARKIASGAVVVVGTTLEIVEHADFVRSHIPPEWVTKMHSDLTVIVLLAGLCLYLLITGEEKEQQSVLISSPPVSNANTITVEGGQKVEQHFHYPPSAFGQFAPPLSVTTPAPQSKPSKPEHNVQCIGFRHFEDDSDLFPSAELIFKNVPTGELLGKFMWPRLRVIYYDNSTGIEIADMCPLVWRMKSGNAPNEIGTEESYAQLATQVPFVGWRAFEINEDADEFGERNELNPVELPTGELRIVATLSGGYKASIKSVTGVLTLGEDGTASFSKMGS